MVSFLGNIKLLSLLEKTNIWLLSTASITPRIDQGTLPTLQQREPQIVFFNNSLTAFELVPRGDFVITEMNGGLIVIPSSVFGNA